MHCVIVYRSIDVEAHRQVPDLEMSEMQNIVQGTVAQLPHHRHAFIGMIIEDLQRHEGFQVLDLLHEEVLSRLVMLVNGRQPRDLHILKWSGQWPVQQDCIHSLVYPVPVAS